MAAHHPSPRPAPNVLFLLAGLILIIAGVALMAFGALTAFQAIPRGDLRLGAVPDARGDLAPVINGFTVVIAGCTTLTAGRYLWRGARRRGLRDRLGRLLVISGYLVVTVALYVLTRYLLRALATDDADASVRIVLNGLVVCALIAVPGSLLAVPGFRMAREEPLMRAEARARF
ncbi:hypothetical protein [Actinomadura macrotermitis]|uniref:DUF2975 domain-containing protein n=1 Tax=Actinomadura macrotermitis TaxID=2585200 RepID=A0A7K0C410_9ACTN|nr:hypothetical protein [Actinomadura macrotermitis]MQY08197.1 hypothetical protein [Actinomadura macrotermitis]